MRKHLDAFGIGLGVTIAAAMLIGMVHDLPDPIIGWLIFGCWCWFMGWVLVWIYRGYRWVRSKSWEIDND